MATFADVDLKLLRDSDFSNEEVIELTILFSQLEDVSPYHEHIQVLRSKYNPLIEIMSLELELFKYPDRLDSAALRKIFVALEDVGYDPMFYDILNYYQGDINAGTYVTKLSEAIPESTR